MYIKIMSNKLKNLKILIKINNYIINIITWLKNSYFV